MSNKNNISKEIEKLEKEFRQREEYLVKKIRDLQAQNKNLQTKSWRFFWSIRVRITSLVKLWNRLMGMLLFRKIHTFFFVYSLLGIRGSIYLIRHKLGILEGFPFDHNVVDYLFWQKNIEPTTISKDLPNSTDIKISIVMPVWNIAPKYLKQAVDSVERQTYLNWEICMYDDASTNKATLRTLKQYEQNPKIKIQYGEQNKNISFATNEALKLATGEFVLFLDNDDMLAPHALNEIVKVIKTKNADVIYYDEDIILGNNLRVKPILKPAWSPETLDATMFLAHSVYRRSLVEKVGGMRKGFEGSQDYDLILRVRDLTQNIVHIPKVLYHWRRITGSTADFYEAKATPKQSAQKALKESIDRRKLSAKLVDGLTAPSFRFKYKIKNNPLVSIIIPIRDNYKYLENLIISIEKKTIYKNYEILVMNNQSEKPETLQYLKKLKKKYRVVDYDDEFNFSAINNTAVRLAKGKHILLLNNDMKVISRGWLESMLEFSQQKSIGAVGALLLFEDNTIQHAGCAIGIGGVAGHLYKYGRLDDSVMNASLDFPHIIHNVSAVTGACLMVEKSIYLEVGGLDENLKVAFNDIDFCLKVLKAGYRNVYTPFTMLYHYESKSRGYEYLDPSQEFRFSNEVRYFKKKWKQFLKEGDPYYNPNFTRENEFGGLVTK